MTFAFLIVVVNGKRRVDTTAVHCSPDDGGGAWTQQRVIKRERRRQVRHGVDVATARGCAKP
jgi:hypothetical protein